MSQRRVVVTGLGALTPLGKNVSESWTNLVNSRSGLTPITKLPDFNENYDIPHQFPSSLSVGCIPSFYGHESNNDAYPENLFTSQDMRRMNKFSKYAIISTYEALKDAKLISQYREQQESNGKFKLNIANIDNFGCSIGSGIASISDTVDAVNTFNSKKKKKISPLLIPLILNNMAASHIAIKFGLRGPLTSTSTACATGGNSIGDAYHLIKLKKSDIMVCGAAEASIHPIALSGFYRAKSLSSTGISRPFDSSRDGFVLGEGAGILILEELEHALKRGCTKIYGEIVGYGMSSDAYHITAPDPTGNGALRAMQMATTNVNTNIDSKKPINWHVNCHSTSTKLGDFSEIQAITQLFRNTTQNKLINSGRIGCSSNKGSMGHLLGAAGAVEAIFTLKSLEQGIVPHTLNLNEVDPNIMEVCDNINNNANFKIELIKKKPMQIDLDYAISNSFGFGGVNASLCFKKYT
ncbi:related to 3-oxoacyl-[acyl-carrier-protein] synthase homolog [Saccharomycodes ludwigii]|uniref:beta-ketoacyl-[acyl-carrier-protein] synthase I n=1 Tax=Saccharomycodes ludwigii TaxID=36035 RepID=A0A376BBP3_9ASCO|nr:related to 3-oxoacyl-[acyl-carrier-protein] synthase homolog [Saccharomycodes ludwigii]